MRPCADPGRSQRLQKRGSDSDSGRMLSHSSVEELVGRGLEEFPCPTFVEEGDHGSEDGYVEQLLILKSVDSIRLSKFNQFNSHLLAMPWWGEHS